MFKKQMLKIQMLKISLLAQGIVRGWPWPLRPRLNEKNAKFMPKVQSQSVTTEDGRQMAEDREKNAKQTQSVTTEDRKPKAEDREKNAKQSQI